MDDGFAPTHCFGIVSSSIQRSLYRSCARPSWVAGSVRTRRANDFPDVTSTLPNTACRPLSRQSGRRCQPRRGHCFAWLPSFRGENGGRERSPRTYRQPNVAQSPIGCHHQELPRCCFVRTLAIQTDWLSGGRGQTGRGGKRAG
jgi:hypothetical protein